MGKVPQWYRVLPLPPPPSHVPCVSPAAAPHQPAGCAPLICSSSPLLLPHTNLLDVHKRYAPGTLSKLLHKLDAEVKAALTSVQGADLLVCWYDKEVVAD